MKPTVSWALLHRMTEKSMYLSSKMLFWGKSWSDSMVIYSCVCGSTDLMDESHGTPPQLHQNENSRCGLGRFSVPGTGSDMLEWRRDQRQWKLWRSFAMTWGEARVQSLSWAELLWDPQTSLHTPLCLTLRIQSRHHVWWIFLVVNFTVPGIS